MSGFEIKSVRGTADKRSNSLQTDGSVDIPVRRRLPTASRAKFFEDLCGPEGQKSFPIPHVSAYAGLSTMYHDKAEIDILSREADRLVEILCPKSKVLVEFLGGQPSVASTLLGHIERLSLPLKYYAISPASIDILKAFSMLEPWKFKCIQLVGLHGSFEDACEWLAIHEKGVPKTVLWLSPSIVAGAIKATFDRVDVAVFLRRLTAHALRPGDHLLIGTERRGTTDVLWENNSRERKTASVLEGLLRCYGLYFESARETFSENAWDLDDEYDPVIGARRSYVVAKRDMRLTDRIFVKAGERILMEQSFKYDEGDIQEILRFTGLDHYATFTDSQDAYDLRILTLPERKTPKHFDAMKAYFDTKQG